MTLVSIIIPVYNRAHLVGKTLDSILAQSYQDWESIIVDDGSTDNTFEILKIYQNRDKRIKAYNRPSDKLKGANACRNFGFENSNGEYINWFDSDDVMHSQYLAEQVKELNKSTINYSISQSKWKTINNQIVNGFRSNALTSRNPIDDYIRFEIFWPIDTVCYKKSFLTNNQLKFDETLQQSQEYDFHVKVLQIDNNYSVINNQLVTIISSEDSISYSKDNSYIKTVSSIKVRKRFLSLSNDISYQTKLFLMNDIFRIFQQQTLQRHINASFYAGWSYLIAHFKDPKIAKTFFLKHLLPVVIVTLIYNFIGRGYNFFKKSNTFNYDKNKCING